jgi:Flp pilus assembly pilin Flp
MAIKLEAQQKPPENNGLPPWGEETVMELILKFYADEAGASAVEYAVLLTLIAFTIFGSVSAIGTTLARLFEKVAF